MNSRKRIPPQGHKSRKVKKTRHILLIDPLEKLNLKKDSSMLLALSLRQAGHQVGLLFLSDLYWSNRWPSRLAVVGVEGTIGEDFYLRDVRLGAQEWWELDRQTIIHMRLDPPFDSRYLRTLWLLEALQARGVQVLNDPKGIMNHNEKIAALKHSGSLASFVGNGSKALEQYLDDMTPLRQKSKNPWQHAIIKPLDMFQGYGVVKVPWEREALLTAFKAELANSGGPLVVQPFASAVEKGETRAIYYKGKELGSILKTPPWGQFLANIAQGASYKVARLSVKQKKCCEQICRQLRRHGVDWVAFDLIGDVVSEVNVTCPGLLVEVSSAMAKNLAAEMVKTFK